MAELITIARPYAKAAYLHAVEHDLLDQWEVMLASAAAVAQDPKMLEISCQPGLTAAEKAAIFCEVLGDVLDEGGKNLIAQLAQHRRIEVLPDIHVLYHQLLAEHQKSTDVELVAAEQLDDAEVEKLVSALKKRLGRDVRLTTSVDASLIGGVLVKAGDTVIDGSIRGRLGRLAEQLNF